MHGCMRTMRIVHGMHMRIVTRDLAVSVRVSLVALRGVAGRGPARVVV